MSIIFSALRPLLHSLPPEYVHHLGLWALANGFLPPASIKEIPALKMKCFGLEFNSPIGLAAGFDKNAQAVNGLLKQGFGFVETGTVTPKPQPGNPKPRIFRLAQDRAVINRLGFNNDGLEVFLQNFVRRDKKLGIVGANIGKNKTSGDTVADYVCGLKAVYSVADYITLNISSPNTQGLRDLQQHDALNALLKELVATRDNCALQENTKNKTPLLLKVAPDLDNQQKEDIASLILEHGLDGLIVSNTTTSRPDMLQSSNKNQAGGLSGAPLFTLSTQALADFYRLTGGKIPIIGVGGVNSPEAAYAKIRAGASLIQLYSALVYEGFGLVPSIHEGLASLIERDGFSHLSEAIGADVS